MFGCVDSFAARDELERVARRYLTPYIDIGMDVHQHGERFTLSGQVAVSMPGAPCLHCMAILTADRLAQEAAEYGRAGGRPQVVWSNGVLASTAVGLMVQLFTPWGETCMPTLLVEYDGNGHELRRSSAHQFLAGTKCPHFVFAADLGDPWYQETSTR